MVNRQNWLIAHPYRPYIMLCIHTILLTIHARVLCYVDQNEEGSPSLARKVQVKRRRLKSQTMVKQSHSRTFLLQGKLNVLLYSEIIWRGFNLVD